MILRGRSWILFCEVHRCCHFFFSSSLFKLSCCLCRLCPPGAHAEMKFHLAQQSLWKLWMFRKFNIDSNFHNCMEQCWNDHDTSIYSNSMGLSVLREVLLWMILQTVASPPPLSMKAAAQQAPGVGTVVVLSGAVISVHIKAFADYCYLALLNIQGSYLHGRHAWLVRRDLVLLTPWPPHHPSSTQRPWLWPDDLLNTPPQCAAPLSVMKCFYLCSPGSVNIF